jgi:hypothetical protein
VGGLSGAAAVYGTGESFRCVFGREGGDYVRGEGECDGGFGMGYGQSDGDWNGECGGEYGDWEEECGVEEGGGFESCFGCFGNGIRGGSSDFMMIPMLS